MIFGSLGVARAQTVWQLMIWRFIQAMGASPGLSVGAGVIGDIYRLEERGVALGSYFGVRPTILIDLISGQIFPWIRLVSLASLLRLLLVV